MENTEKMVITSLLVFLCENTTSVDQLTIFAKSVFLMTESEREEILAPRSSYNKNHRFYVHMMKKSGGMKHLLRFLKHVQVQNYDVARRLKEELKVANKAAEALCSVPGHTNGAGGSGSRQRLIVPGDNYNDNSNEYMKRILKSFPNNVLSSSTGSVCTENQYRECNANIVSHQDINRSVEKQILTTSNSNIYVKPAQSSLRIHFNLHNHSPYFTGRKRDLQRLEKAINILHKDKSPSNKTMIVSGLGGVGKTELVRKFATQKSTTKIFKYVIVINAASYTAAKTDFKNLADDVLREASDRTNLLDRRIQDVYFYFSRQTDGKTLFVFENAGHWARRFLPHESVGTGNYQLPIVLIISRRNDWEDLSKHHLRINGWDRKEAVKYLTHRLLAQQKVRITADVQTWLCRLRDSLHSFPLALSIAISKILKYHQNVTVDKIRNYLLAKDEDNDTWRIQEISNLAPTDYKLTMDTVFNADIQNIYTNKDDGVTALHLLRIVSNKRHVHPELNPQITSLEMHKLCEQNGLGTDVAEALSILYNYSIFQMHRNKDGEFVSSQIHDIIQLCSGKWNGSYLEQFCNRNENWV